MSSADQTSASSASAAAASGAPSAEFSSSAYTDLFAKGTNYASFRPTYPNSLFRDILAYESKTRQTADKHKSVAMDVGCGTGQATIELAKLYDSVIGVEGSKSQLQAAAKADNVKYLEGVAEKLPAEAESIDLVAVAQAFHWFDPPKFFAECDRILRPGGCVAIWTYAMAQIDNKAANELLQTFHFKTMGPYWDERRALVDNKYKDVQLPESLERRQRLTSWMEKSMNLVGLINYIGTWSAYKTFCEKHPKARDPRIALQADLQKVYGEKAADKINLTVKHEITLLFGQKK